MEALVAAITVFVLAIFIGFEIITKVPPTLHTPLMSGSNAISGITIIGALILAGAVDSPEISKILATVAVAFAAVHPVYSIPGVVILGVYFGTMAAQLKQVLDDFVGVRRKMEDKVGAAFSTSGDASGGKETTMMSIIQALLIYGMIVVGDPMSATGHYGTACAGAPDAAVRENGSKLGRRVAELVKRFAR